MLDDLLIESAARHPWRVAVVDRTESMTYRELEAASARLASELAAHGAGPGARVGLYLDKSLEAIVAVWAVLRSGAAYVPLDVASPVKRVARIVENGELCGILTASKRWAALAPALAVAPAFAGMARTAAQPAERGFDFERSASLPKAVAEAASAKQARDPSRTAYILYTSGSTGQPKGVALSHRAARAFVDWAADTTQLVSTDIVSSHAPLHFDLSVFDVFASCRAGACVALVPPDLNVFPRNLADWIARERISVWYSVPSLLARLALSGGLERHDFSHLRQIIFAGEVFRWRSCAACASSFRVRATGTGMDRPRPTSALLMRSMCCRRNRRRRCRSGRRARTADCGSSTMRGRCAHREKPASFMSAARR